MPLIIIAAGVALLLVLMIGFKVNGFIALVLVAAVVGFAEGMGAQDVLHSIQNGIGGTLGGLAMILGFGAMLDKRQRRKILYLGSKDDIRDEQRYHGYCDAMTRRGLAPLRINPRAISSIHLGIQLMRDALAAHPDVDGVFCTNDDIAMGALLWCRERQLAVPEQISIAGFHGLEMGRQMIPSLASVITPRFEIGRRAAQMLLNKIKNNDLNHNTIDLGYQIYHGSTL
ncbi:substrate-binding domain-containing protein [Salmonella enterica]|nr:substrate-binding domain-containing protein [Salmonella enterica]